MATPNPVVPVETLVDLWYRALRAEVGIVVKCWGDRDLVRNDLYVTRRNLMDDDLTPLSVVRSPDASDELWIVRKDKLNEKVITPATEAHP